MSGDPWQATFGPWVAHNGGPRPDSVAADAMVQALTLKGALMLLNNSDLDSSAPIPAAKTCWPAVACYRVQRTPVREVIGLYHRGEREPFATVVFIDGKADWTTVRMME